MNSGIVIVNKPPRMTSHDVVAKVRRRFNTKKVGHAGTLDPLATGVLIMLIGKGTKLFDQFVGMDKAYRTTMILGTRTTTADTDGEVIETKPYDHITEEEVQSVLKQFLGEGQQLPPMYSAVKVRGRKLYEWARKGIEIERKARDIRIDVLKLEHIQLPKVSFYLECSKGTYVRSLVDDIGKVLGCGACVSAIERTKVGSFSIDEAIDIEDLHEDHIRDW